MLINVLCYNYDTWKVIFYGQKNQSLACDEQ